MYNTSIVQQQEYKMASAVLIIVLVFLTIATWTIDTGPLNWLWLVMLVIDFWAVIAIVAYEALRGLILTAKRG